ncbi:MAG: glucose-6-phosphate dehydrogenase [Rhizobacter sp.]|nr:glucose-6-phosphate dehydrogenase [Chlorobiales bacterium]
MPNHTSVVIFGGSGDLTKRKLIPALYSLAARGMTDKTFSIIGFARTKKSDDAFRNDLTKAIHEFKKDVNDAVWQSLLKNIHYVSGGYGDAAAHQALHQKIAEINGVAAEEVNTLYYLSTPPEEFQNIIEQLGAIYNRANRREDVYRRIIIEKPFGYDLASAVHLNDILATYFRERDIFRIDHYLGKETVQNVLVFRFANAIFEPLWNSRFIDNIQITVAEDIGVGSRAAYYDKSGALRDMIENHILQVLSYVTMEAPIALTADAVRDEKVKLLRSVKIYTPEQANGNSVRAQYSGGVVDGENVKGYREEDESVKDSQTETYVLLKLEIDNWRWFGVPVYVRTGKRMTKRATEISVAFKASPSVLFNAGADQTLEENVIAIRVQPNEGISLLIDAKVPGGTATEIKSVQMDYRYKENFQRDTPEAYERLLHDAMTGDPALFIRRDESETAWHIVEPFLTAWQQPEAPLYTYPAGTWGPNEADELIHRDNRHWHRV